MNNPTYEYRVVCDAGGTAPATNQHDARIVCALLDQEHPEHGPHRPERRLPGTHTWEPAP